jgi:hypothetical protein
VQKHIWKLQVHLAAPAFFCTCYMYWWWSFRLRHHVDCLVDANVSEMHAVSIFSDEDEESMVLLNVGFYKPVHMVP